jgi:tetratricopeptide (TPR) repeat protein
MGNLDEAMEHYQLALAIRKVKAVNSSTLANSYNKIGSVLKDKGDLDAARDYWRHSATQF